MTALTFALKHIPQQRVDVAALTPQRLQGLSLNDIAVLSLPCGNQSLRVDQLFDLSGTDTSHLIFQHSNNKLDNIGQGLQDGQIDVHGDAGAYLGADMRGGKITVHGHIAVYGAAGMAGGEICIHGNAGDYLAAARPGERRSMQGGRVIVGGNAGDRVGDRLRRGMIIIEGDAGAFCGTRMIAGTIAVFGGVGEHPGYAMRRGTLLLSQIPSQMPATFNDNGIQELLFLRLLLPALSYPGSPSRLFTDKARRFVGDMASLGKGEILSLVTAA